MTEHDRDRRRAAIAAWGVCGLTFAAAAWGAVLVAALSGTDWDALVPGATPPSESAAVAILDVGWLTAYAVIGAVVAVRRPRNAVGWCLCLFPLLMSSIFLGEGVYWHAASAHPADPGLVARLGLCVANVGWVPAVLLVFVLLPLLFPTGRPPTARWRPIGVAAVAGAAILLLATALDAGPLENYPWVENLLGVAPWLDRVAWIGFALMFGSAPLTVASVVVRFRRSHGVEREQLKWFAAAAALLVVMFVVSALLAPHVTDDADWALVATGLLAVILAVGIAMLRYRLYDIDVVINRALVYGGLTATLAVAYLASVIVLQLALSPLTGDSSLAIAASTLAVAALSRPARARIQGLVDRRFYRRRYDAQRTLEAFAASLRDEIALDALDEELRAVVRATMQPAHVSLWLRGPMP